jgi:hypothetical protein
MEKNYKDFEITGGGLMKTFLGMEVEQSGKKIKLHFDDYNIKQVLGGFQGICQDDATPLDGTDMA